MSSCFKLAMIMININFGIALRAAFSKENDMQKAVRLSTLEWHGSQLVKSHNDRFSSSCCHGPRVAYLFH